MQKTLSPIFALFVVAASACAAPQISGDQQVKPGGFALLTLTGADAAIWDCSPEPIQAAEIAGSFVFTGVPGTTYNVRAIIIDFAAKKIDRVRYTVVFLGGPGPGPAPPVPPGPVPPIPPGPTPISPFAKRLQDAAIADGWAKAKLADVAAGVTAGAACFRTGIPAQQVRDDLEKILKAKVPPLGRKLAALLDEQVTATLDALNQNPTKEMDRETADRMRVLFENLAAALLEASR